MSHYKFLNFSLKMQKAICFSFCLKQSQECGLNFSLKMQKAICFSFCLKQSQERGLERQDLTS